MTSSNPSKTSQPADTRLYVRFEDDPYGSFGGRYCHVYVRPMVLARETHTDRPVKLDLHSPDYYGIDADDATRALAHIVVQAQMDETTDHFYGYRLTCTLDRAELRDLEAVLPVMRKLSKRMTALSDRFGYPRDIAGFLAHLADAMMPRTSHPFMRSVDAEHDYEGTGYRSMDADALRYWLAEQATAWRELHGITVKAD